MNHKLLFSALKEEREPPPRKEKNRTIEKYNDGNEEVKQNVGKTNTNEGRRQKTFIIIVKINGQEAIALLDSGCTMEAISPEWYK